MQSTDVSTADGSLPAELSPESRDEDFEERNAFPEPIGEVLRIFLGNRRVQAATRTR
ncbi:hypothetical protein GCM10009730_60010 [Streptomyces albidochromogenes]|uniref:hypothetical protein n=1 Tax=Streptomyces albidochromogenes TaxID=329524 RepID=UPI00142EDE73|nr:hypothetical protein [Streptomyces albidochromogenes]